MIDEGSMMEMVQQGGFGRFLLTVHGWGQEKRLWVRSRKETWGFTRKT